MNHDDIARQYWARLRDERDTIHVLLRYRDSIRKMYDQLTSLTAHEDLQTSTKELELIEDYQARVDQYLREEVYCELATYQRATNRVIVDHVPQTMQLIATTNSVTIRGIPLWMLPYAKGKVPSIYHRNRPFIRTSALWNRLINHLKAEYLHAGTSSQLAENTGYARVTFVFRTSAVTVRDLDHYSVSSILNACVANGLILSDHPSRLSLSLMWQDTGLDCADLIIHYSTEPLLPP